MISLKETVDIPAPFEKLDAWVDNFEEEFVKWSPLHLECELFDKGIKKGDRVGQVVFYSDDKKIRECPLYALESVKSIKYRKSILERIFG